MKKKKEGNKKSTLSVNRGVNQPLSVNAASMKSFKTRRRNKISLARYRDGVLEGDISILSRAITLVESSLPEHQDMALELIDELLDKSGNSVRIGITGVPGVGKSSFIESFGQMLIQAGRRLAVLAVDPSSELSGGSILGDKTRMEDLSSSPSAFIRPSPSGGSIGGVAKKTRESIILCEAAGFDTIIVETVGVGQSETAVKYMVDFFLLLMLAGAGDELQGIKRGIMEMADLIAITKSDGNNIISAELARTRYQDALHLFPPPASGWIPRVGACSSLKNEGLDEINQALNEYVKLTMNSGYFKKNRKDQSLYWMNESIDRQLREGFYRDTLVARNLEVVRKDVVEGRISSFMAAKKLIDSYIGRRRD